MASSGRFHSKPWSFLYFCLCKSPTPVSLPVLDTIIFSQSTPFQPLFWVYTDHDNHISRRSISRLSLDDVVKACFQTLSKKTGDEKVCFLVYGRERRLVSLLQLWNVRARGEGLEGVQVCKVKGKQMQEWVYLQEWRGKGGASEVSKRLLEAYFTEVTPSTDSLLNTHITSLTSTILQVLESVHSGSVLYLRLNYLVELGNSYLDSHQPWLLYCEECVMSPGVMKVMKEEIEEEVAMEEVRPRKEGKEGGKTRVVGSRQDPKLAVVTLSPHHFPRVGAIPRQKPIRQGSKRPPPPRPSLSRSISRGASASHSCILPSVDLDQTEPSIQPLSGTENTSKLVSPSIESRRNPVNEPTEVSLQAILQREQSKNMSPRVKFGHKDVGTPALEEELEVGGNKEEMMPVMMENTGKGHLGSRAESPDIKYPLT